MEKGNFISQPDGIEGLRILVQHKPCLRKQLSDFITRLPKKRVGIWVANGWNNAIPNDCDEYNIIDRYLEELKTEGNSVVQGALKNMRRKKTSGYIIP
jgi:kap p-loop